MLMINGLACLLIITSLCVIMVRTAKKAALFYSLQSLVLVLLFVYLAYEMQAHELYMWSISAFITKVILVPMILVYAMKKIDENQTPVGINVAWLIPITAVIVTLCYFVVIPIDLPLVAHLKPALSVSLSHFLLGLVCIVSQRNIVKQVFGYCLMENGSHLTLALLAWIIALLIAPLAISLASFACSVTKTRTICTALHVTGLILMFAFSLQVIAGVLTQGEISSLGNWIHVDSLSAIFLALISVVGGLAGVYSIAYINREFNEGHIDLKTYCNYYGFLHLFFFTMILSVTTNNLILMWAGIEATTLSSAFLVGTYKQKTSLEAAWKYIIICSVGVAFGLFGTILTFSNGTNLLADPSQAIFWTAVNQQASDLHHGLMYLAFAFILVGFGTKCGLFPMHTWLPDAHSEAPSPVSAVLSAVLLNCAMLVVLRYYILVSKAVGGDYPQTLMLVFGLLSTGVASFFIIMQHDIKRKLAYHSIENMGLISFAFGLGGPVGAFAGLLHTITHSLAKALLFCASGNILLKYRSRDIHEVSGLWRTMPFTAVLFAGGALALGGMPPFGMFTSEFAIAVAGIYAGKTWLIVLCLIFLTIALAGLTTMLLKTVLGKPKEGIEVGELNKSSIVILATYLLLLLFMGIYISEPILQLLTNAVGIVLGQPNVSFGDMLVLPWQSLAQ